MLMIRCNLVTSVDIILIQKGESRPTFNQHTKPLKFVGGSGKRGLDDMLIVL